MVKGDNDEFSSTFDCYEVVLDAGADAIFHGGELITGQLKIKLKRPMTIQLIRLQFKGRSCFVERDPKSLKHNEVEKVYFDKDFILLDRPPGKPEPCDFPWKADFLYSLPFECPIPEYCPTSYESPSGYNRYYVRAVVVETGSHKEFLMKRCLNMVPPISRFSKQGSKPVVVEQSLSQGRCCCRTKMQVRAQLEKNMFAPGDRVACTLDISSKHRRKLIELVEVKLVDRVGRADLTKPEFASARVLLSRSLDKSEFDRQTLELFKIPPVAASFPPPSDPVVESTSLSEAAKTLDPVVVHLKDRSFLRLEHEIQISIGGKFLLHFPIFILAPVINKKTRYEPFIGGEQYVDDSDEMYMVKPKMEGFLYMPKYPMQPEGAEVIDYIAANDGVHEKEPKRTPLAEKQPLLPVETHVVEERIEIVEKVGNDEAAEKIEAIEKIEKLFKARELAADAQPLLTAENVEP